MKYVRIGSIYGGIGMRECTREEYEVAFRKGLSELDRELTPESFTNFINKLNNESEILNFDVMCDVLADYLDVLDVDKIIYDALLLSTIDDFEFYMPDTNIQDDTFETAIQRALKTIEVIIKLRIASTIDGKEIGDEQVSEFIDELKYDYITECVNKFLFGEGDADSRWLILAHGGYSWSCVKELIVEFGDRIERDFMRMIILNRRSNNKVIEVEILLRNIYDMIRGYLYDVAYDFHEALVEESELYGVVSRRDGTYAFILHTKDSLENNGVPLDSCWLEPNNQLSSHVFAANPMVTQMRLRNMLRNVRLESLEIEGDVPEHVMNIIKEYIPKYSS